MVVPVHLASLRRLVILRMQRMVMDIPCHVVMSTRLASRTAGVFQHDNKTRHQ